MDIQVLNIKNGECNCERIYQITINQSSGHYDE